MLKLSWSEYKTNDEVLQLAEEQRTLMRTLRQRQKTDETCDSLLKKVDGRMKGRKSLAGQRRCYWTVDEKRIQNGLFTGKEDDRRQN